MKQPSTRNSPRRAERWPASIDIPKQATAIDSIMVATEEVTDAAIHSTAEEIAGIDQTRNVLSHIRQSTAQRPRTVSDPPVILPAVE